MSGASTGSRHPAPRPDGRIEVGRQEPGNPVDLHVYGRRMGPDRAVRRQANARRDPGRLHRGESDRSHRNDSRHGFRREPAEHEPPGPVRKRAGPGRHAAAARRPQAQGGGEGEEVQHPPHALPDRGPERIPQQDGQIRPLDLEPRSRCRVARFVLPDDRRLHSALDSQSGRRRSGCSPSSTSP